MIEKRCKTNFRNWKNNPTVSKLSLISINWNHKWSNLIFHLVSNFIPFPPHWFQDWMRSWNVSHPVASQTKKVSQRVEFTSLSLSLLSVFTSRLFIFAGTRRPGVKINEGKGILLSKPKFKATPITRIINSAWENRANDELLSQRSPSPSRSIRTITI